MIKIFHSAGITGFAEPLGALIGYFIFSSGEGKDTSSAQSLVTFGVLFGITAGIMTEVAIKSLLLESVRYDPTDRIVSTVSLAKFCFYSDHSKSETILDIYF